MELSAVDNTLFDEWGYANNDFNQLEIGRKQSFHTTEAEVIIILNHHQ